MLSVVIVFVIDAMATDLQSDCVICMDSVKNPYTVQCGSETPHLICHPCELQWRLKSRATPEGRTITCPMCRAVETDTSQRSNESIRAELSHVYFELATKIRKSTEINQGVRDYIRLLESIAMVPNIQLDGLSMVTTAEANQIMVTPLPRDHDRAQRVARQRRQEIQAQSDFYARMRREEMVRQEQAAAAIAARREAAARQAAERRERRSATAVWCESGNLLLGACTTSRRTTRPCSSPGCTKRVCSRCDKCTTH